MTSALPFWRISAMVLLLSVVSPAPVLSQQSERWELCVRQYAEGRTQESSSGETRTLIRDIAASMNLNMETVVVIECRFVNRAVAQYTTGNLAGVPAGEYIIYNEQWVREVIGSDRVQAVALFGHEIGHLLNRDFLEPRSSSSRIQLETDADGFAGCAVARAGGDWGSVENLFSRLRSDAGGAYPSRLRSLEAAYIGYDRCRSQQRRAEQPEGSWYGLLHEVGYGEYHLVAVFGASGGRLRALVDYRGIECSGAWDEVSRADHAWVMRETISSAPEGSCMDGATVELQMLHDGRLAYAWRPSHQHAITTTGFLQPGAPR